MYDQDEIDKLIGKLTKVCLSHGLESVYAALIHTVQTVLEVVPHTARNQLALQLMHMVLLSETFDHIRHDRRAEGIDAITAIQDYGDRVSALLGYVKALIILSAPAAEQAEDRALLKLLRRRYITVQRPDESFTPRDLYDLLALAAAIIQTQSEGVARMQLIMTFIQAFISMSDFNDIEAKQLKEVLQAAAAVPDEELRGGRSLKRIEAIVNKLARGG